MVERWQAGRALLMLELLVLPLKSGGMVVS
jgi:hypothetical protein